jgi:spore coat protein A
MISRRQFFKITAATGVGLALAGKGGRFSRPLPVRAQGAPIWGGSLDPSGVLKYQMPLVKPPVMPGSRIPRKGKGKPPDYHAIAMRQFSQPILPPGHPETTVWSYGPYDDPRTVFQGGRYFYPAFTLEAKWNRPKVVRWINDLTDSNGDHLPHLLPVDPTLHWANPVGRRDRRPNPTMDAGYFDHQYIDQDGNYTGPVPMVTHVHGAHVGEESDGYAEAWWLPQVAGADVNHEQGTFFDYFKAKYGFSNDDWGGGAATYTYPNDQRATTLWYHDHTLGMTRVNVYAGPAGFYLVRGGPGDEVLDSRTGTKAILPGPAPGPGINPFGTFYEIPIAIQDRSFNDDGSLFYPDNRAFFHGLEPSDLVNIPYTYDANTGDFGYGCDGEVSDVAPIWNPEFFGNMMVVNGQTWPFLDVEPRRYRLRLLNGCNSRFLILQFSDPRVEVWQIGAEGGFLALPVNLAGSLYPGASGGATILMAPAERADVIVDFTGIPVGTPITLLNLGPDEPFGGGEIGVDFDAADPGSTGQVMEFRVVTSMSVDNSTPPQFLQLPPIAPLTPDGSRQVSLNEEESRNVRVTGDDDNPPITYDCDSPVPFGPTAALLGLVDPFNSSNGIPRLWMDPITENPGVGATETWEIHNFTMDAHPIHLHQIMFQVVDRQPTTAGPSRTAEPWENGWKDTVIAYPGEITRIKAKFDLPGLYVWHCHIVEHEDNEMMRPYHVGVIPGDLPHGETPT